MKRRVYSRIGTGIALLALALAGAATAASPIPTSGVCATHTFRIKSGLQADGRATTGQAVTFEILGYSHRPSGSVRIDFGDGTSDEHGAWSFDAPLTMVHVYGRTGGFTAKLSGGAPPACGAGGQVTLGVVDQSVRSEVRDLTLDAAKITPGTPFSVRVAGNNGFKPCKVQVVCGGDRIEIKGAPFPIFTQCKPLPAGAYVIEARGLEDCGGYASARLVVAPLVAVSTSVSETNKTAALAPADHTTAGATSSRAITIPPTATPKTRAATSKPAATPTPPGRITGAAVNVTSAGATIKIDGSGRCALNLIDKKFGGSPVWPARAGAGPTYVGSLPARIDVHASVPGRDFVSIESAGGPEGCAGSATVPLH